MAPLAPVVLVFRDDLSEANGTALAGKAPGASLPWQQTLGANGTIQGNAIETQGAARVIAAPFLSALGPNQTLTVAVNRLDSAGTMTLPWQAPAFSLRRALQILLSLSLLLLLF